MTLPSKICSTVLRPAPKLASPCVGGWSTLWSCNPRLSQASLLTSDLVHPISHFFCSQIFCDRADSAFTIPSTPLRISPEGMSSIPRYLPVFTAGSTSPSVPADCPHCLWKTSWFEIWSRRCRVSSQLYMSPHYPAHLLRTPSLSVISLLSLFSMTPAIWFW